MKKIIIAFACAVYIMSCNSENTSGEAEAEDVPSSVDTTAHPTGVNEGAVISTDTAAYNVENTNPGGRDSLEKDKKE
jgi:hypothetical protein